MGNHSPTVVLIDDSDEVRELVKAQFRLSGLLTVVADGSDGVEAIGLAHRHRPDLLLLDMSMPTLDGLDALPGILAVSPETRVVMFTGFQERGLAERAKALGAADLLEKSVPVGQLALRLLAILTDGRPGSAPRAGLEVVPDPPETAAEGQTRLDEHLERFREVFDQAAIGMATITLTGGIVRANRALGDLVLRRHEDLVGVDYATLTSGRGDLLADALNDITRHGHDIVHVEHDVSGAPEPRRARATLAAVRDSSGQALYVFLQVQDITAQRAAEDELRLSEERFRLLVEVVEEYAIFMLSPEGIVVSWNAGAQRNKGYRADEIIGRHFRTFYRPDLQAARHPEYELERALGDGHYAEEGWRVRKDGSEFWASVVITAIFDDAGQHLGFAKVTRDLTDQRRAQDERERAAADRTQFLAVTAHELRTPAAVLSGSAETLARHWTELPDDERLGLLEGMTTSADRLGRLVSDLLTVSRLDAKALRLTPVPTSAIALLTTSAETARLAGSGADVRVEGVTDAEILADPDRIAQAVDNLIGNALAHGAPPVHLSVTAPGSMAEIRVTDAGDGVDPGVLGRLFERFATGNSVSGTGLGLFIARELARANGGDAFYEPGTAARPGSTFVLTVPLA